MKTKLFSKDFMLVVIGQIISLFGNAALRFALPLYLLNQTGSSSLYGTVAACAFIPAIVLSPIGGMIADRVNKRNIMVVLDLLTAALILGFSLLMDRGNLIVLLTVTMMLLYGIAGTYQPAVQASIPALVSREKLMAANSVINTISSFASLMGPILGGILYSVYGLKTLLAVCIVCFFISAVMEVFIRIPYVKQSRNGGVFKTVKEDFSESLYFIRKEKPVIGKGLLVVCGVNLFLSAVIIVGVPYMITVVMNFPEETANKLYGFAQGALAAGGLAGGICAGVFAEKLSVKKAGSLLAACAASVFPIGIFPMVFSGGFFNYGVIVLCCFCITVLSTLFSVQMMAFVQGEAPKGMTGKVVAVMITAAMCAQPAGTAMYGILFEVCAGYESAVFLFAGVISLFLGIASKKIFGQITRAGQTAGEN